MIGAFMESLKYVVFQEGKYFVSKCLNAEVSSFGETIDEAVNNLKEAVELYLEDSDATFSNVGNALIGEVAIHA